MQENRDPLALADRMTREQAEHREAEHIKAAFGESSAISELAGRARDALKGAQAQKASLVDPKQRAAIEEEIARVPGAALLDRDRLWFAEIEGKPLVLVLVVAPFDPQGGRPGATTLVLLADAAAAFADIAAEERRLLEAHAAAVREEQQANAARLEREFARDRERRERERRDAPFRQLPVAAAAALHVAAETSGQLRKALIAFAELACHRELGAPENADAEITALAERLAAACREAATLAAQRAAAAERAKQEDERRRRLA